jgi:hypothetical protein
MSNQQLHPGQQITAPFLPAAAEVKGFSQRSGYARLEAVLLDGSDQFITRSISFALMILQRRLTSSSQAIYLSLQRRKARLETLLELPEKIRGDEDYLKAKGLTEDDLAEMAEEEWLTAEYEFKHQGQIMVATEAAGEGINRHFAGEDEC